MKPIVLTIPLYPHMPVGNVWAWDVPFQTEDIVTYKKQGPRLFMITMHSETGTRLMWKGVQENGAETVMDLDLNKFINKPAVIVDVPKGPFGEILPEDIECTLAKEPEYQEGDAVILRTGWGNEQRWKKIGDAYAYESPHFTNPGAQATVDVMVSKGSEFLVTDCAYIGNTGEGYMREQWAKLPAWERPAYPHEEAKAYLRNYTPDMWRVDFGSSIILLDKLYVIGGACNLDQLQGKRTTLVCLPMFIEDACGTSAWLVALEKD